MIERIPGPFLLVVVADVVKVVAQMVDVFVVVVVQMVVNLVVFVRVVLMPG